MPDRQLIRTRAGLGRDPLLEGRRVLDLAQGILIALRRYRAESAFEELVSVAYKHDVPVSAVAAGLLMLASGSGDSSASDGEQLAIARLAWGDLLSAS